MLTSNKKLEAETTWGWDVPSAFGQHNSTSWRRPSDGRTTSMSTCIRRQG